MTLAEIVIDPSTIAIACGAAISWLLGISFVLGRYSERQKHLEEAQTTINATILKIFAKLDELAKSVPHVCMQAEKIVRLEADVSHSSRRLGSLESWRNDSLGMHGPHLTPEGGEA